MVTGISVVGLSPSATSWMLPAACVPPTIIAPDSASICACVIPLFSRGRSSTADVAVMFALLTVYFFSVLHPDADNVVLTLVLSPAEVSIHVYPVDSAAVQYQTRLLVLSMYSWPTTPTVDVVGGSVPMMGWAS